MIPKYSAQQLWKLVVCIALLVVIADQICKEVVLMTITPGDSITVIPGFFNLTLHYNPGVAFGMFAGLPDGMRQLVLTVSTLLALGLVMYFLFTDYRSDKWGQSALALVLGGAFGNVFDRFRHGRVVDYLDFHWGANHWPAFNLADSCICIGVAILLVRSPKRNAVVAETKQAQS